MSHPEFPNIVDQAWALPALNLFETFCHFAVLVSAWNKSTFGNIFHRKKHILARINGVQNALSLNPLESLSRLERSLREEFSSILQLEEEF